MKNKLITLFTLVALILSGCNLPSNVAPTETPIPSPLPTNTASLPTETPLPTGTPLPTNTPLPTLTFTPSVPTINTLDQPVNCRYGPGTAWVVTSALSVGQSAQIVGKNFDASWWYIQDPLNPGKNCWVAGSVTVASGNLSLVQVVQTPSASVTNVSLSLEPKLIDLILLCVGVVPPVKFKGKIETNGPTSVKWYFETQQGGAQPVKTTEFETYGAKEVSGEYQHIAPIAEGEYVVRLIITSPNSLLAEAKYKIDCQ